MPYWEHLGEFLKCSERLSYLLSQGVHCCDVAVIYPVTPMQAEMDGRESVSVAFDAGNQLFSQGIDFDFMDSRSLSRTQTKDGKLHIAGEAYRVLILPSMKAIRYSSIKKALDFYRAGGMVIAMGNLPEASDRVGSDDPELNDILQEIFTIFIVSSIF